MPIITVGLDTTDERVARKRLRDIVVAKQQELEGIVAPAAIREAASVQLVDLVEDYRHDLAGRGLAAAHVKESVARILRIVGESGWKILSDVRPETFVKWRASFRGAAKTKKEYQTSISAFLNWLVRVDRLMVNPLAKVDRVDIRGKAVRKSRAYTLDEFRALCRVAPAYRRLVYLFLVYTGARTDEARSLRWSSVDLGVKPSVLFRAENTKDHDNRAVPLRLELAVLFREQLKKAEAKDALVFPVFPSDDALHADLARAGIERKNASAHVVHFHAFRKTFQTWGAVAGVGQRSAQELLGHSDPSLTANVYTDVAALALHDEVAKLPWIDDAPPNAHESVRPDVRAELRDLLTKVVTLAQTIGSEVYAGITAPNKMAARHGFEP